MYSLSCETSSSVSRRKRIWNLQCLSSPEFKKACQVFCGCCARAYGPTHRVASGVDLSTLVSGGAGAAVEINVSGNGASGSSTPSDSTPSLVKLLARERSSRSKLFSQAAAGSPASSAQFSAAVTPMQPCPPSARWMPSRCVCNMKSTCRFAATPAASPSYLIVCRLLRSRPRTGFKTSCR